MDVPPLESWTRRPAPVPRTQHPRGTAAAQVPPAHADGETKAAAPSAVPQLRLTAEVSRRPDGVQQVTMIDTATGEAVYQTPPDAVMNVVDAALWRMRRAEEHRA
jgi:hypothetical protein